MKVIVFGGDGFCGWPTALHSSHMGHDIVIVDNLSRRNIDNELETNSLTPILKPIPSMPYLPNMCGSIKHQRKPLLPRRIASNFLSLAAI